MRVVVQIGLVTCLGATLLGTPQGPPKDATAVLAAARAALGGEQNIGAVKNFVVTGRTRQVRGDNLVPIEFEIAVELPDKYVRKDEIPAQESGPTSTGFNGDGLIQVPAPVMPPARAGAPPPSQAQLDAARRMRLTPLKQDFVRLTLGMFATSFPIYPLTFTYVGQAEAPEGKAEVVDAKGPDNFTVRLFVNSQTNLPIMLSWQVAPAGRGRPMAPPAGATPPGAPGATPSGATPPGAAGPPTATPPPVPGPPPAGAPPQAAGAPAPGPRPPAGPGQPAGAVPSPAAAGQPPAAAPKPVEHRLYFADYRQVGNLQLPFRIKRAVGPDTTEETTFDRFRINAKIDPRKFEVRK